MTHTEQPDVALVKLTAAHAALAECTSAVEAKHIADIADAAKVYLMRTRASQDAVDQATEIRLLAERQMGRFLADEIRSEGGRPRNGPPGGPFLSLHQLGITKNQSARAQRLASMPDAAFWKAIDNAKKSTGRLTIKAVEKHAVKTRASTPQSSPTDRSIATDLGALDGSNFGCIYADPPWRYDNQGTRGSTDNHYVTMTVDEIAALPVAALVADNAHLHLWTTNAFLRDSFDVMDAWGFEFKSTFVWVKPQMGMGNYWRNSHEIMLTGVRGKLTAASKSEMSWVECARGRHSAKPDVVRDRIMRISPGPYLELFGRRSVAGWTVYGNEVQHELV